MASEDERDAADGARSSTSGSAKRVKTARRTKSTRSSNMASEDERDAADGARPSTSGSAKRVKTAGGTKRKGKSSMGRKAKRDAADGARSSTRGSVKRVKKAGGTKLEVERNAAYGAMRVRTHEGTEVETNGAWTARIKVTAALKDAFDSVKEFGKFVLENPELILEKLRFALECWGIIKKFGYGSIILDLDCGSQEKFLEFQKDFQNGKVKDAMETEFREIGYNGKLELKLTKETPNVVIFKMSIETRTKETKEFFIVNPNPDVVSHGKRKGEKESAKKAASGSTEVKQEKKSGSAAKKPKLDPIGEPGTSEVSNTSETGKFKEGIVTDHDLQTLGQAIGDDWDQLARRLPGIKEEHIQGIENKYGTLAKRGYQILKLWKSKNAKAADYETLYNALDDKLVGRKDLAEDYCLK